MMLGKDEDSYIMLPEVLSSFQGSDKKSEIVSEVSCQLQLKWMGTDYGENLEVKTIDY